MLKAGALYFSIVVAFMIAIISASLIMLAAHYRSSYLKEIRFSRLLLNLNSATELILADREFQSDTSVIDLYGEALDSALIEKRYWGMYEQANVKAFFSGDTLQRSFLIGRSDSTDLTAVYLSDEDRPLSVGGHAKIIGEALLPKSGIKQSYVDGKPYEGKELVSGRISNSKRTLPGLKEADVNRWTGDLQKDLTGLAFYSGGDLHHSFFSDAKRYRLKPGTILTNHLKGNIILYADTTVTLSAASNLDGIQVYAPFIKVEDGFKGRCQLFASDSISVGNRVRFSYPSALAVIRTASSGDLPKITCGAFFNLQGILFSYEETRSPLQTLIAIGEKSNITGEIYASGIIKLEKGLKIRGKVSCNRFLMQTPQTLYENVLIDVELNRKARSKHYCSGLISSDGKTGKKILQWLE